MPSTLSPRLGAMALCVAVSSAACAPQAAGRIAAPTAGMATERVPAETAPEPPPPVSPPPLANESTLAALHRRFHTKVLGDRREQSQFRDAAAPGVPPKAIFERVKYPSSVGPLWAYVTPAPAKPVRLPAIVWAVGGFSNSVDESLARPGPVANDQTAAAFREAGMVLMLPSYRGGNDNPGVYEELYGEVDDFVAAIEYVRTLPYVDPDRIYLGGHSTGGTLVLLACEITSHFRAAFVFGPSDEPRGYGEEHAPFDVNGPDATSEWNVRTPVSFLGDIQRPVYLFEGREGNVGPAHEIAKMAKKLGAPVEVHPLTWGDHFSVLHPMTRRIAKQIAKDTGATPSFDFGPAETAKP